VDNNNYILTFYLFRYLSLSPSLSPSLSLSLISEEGVRAHPVHKSEDREGEGEKEIERERERERKSESERGPKLSSFPFSRSDSEAEPVWKFVGLSQIEL
jgi:hypothetical protein